MLFLQSPNRKFTVRKFKMHPYEEAYVNILLDLQYKLYYNRCNLLAGIMSNLYVQNDTLSRGCPLQVERMESSLKEL